MGSRNGQNSLRVLMIDLGRLSRCAAVFSLYPLNVPVAKTLNNTEVDGEKYGDNANGRSSQGTGEGGIDWYSDVG